MASGADPVKINHVAKQLQKAQLQLSQMAAKISSGTLTPEELAECEQTITDMQAKIDRLSMLGTKPTTAA